MIRVLPILLLLVWGGVALGEASDVTAAIDRGSRFLLADQNPDGSWGSARQTKGINILSPVPGTHRSFRVATTALCLEALYDTGLDRDGAEASFRKGMVWLLENAPALRRGQVNVMNNIWGYAFSLQLLAKVQGDPRFVAERGAMREVMPKLIRALETYESVNGGWGYYDNKVRTYKPGSDSNTFITATVLLALQDARGGGIDVPDRLLTRGKQLLLRLRKSDFTYLYNFQWRYYPMRKINRPAANLGRSQACNLALRRLGDETVTDEVMKDWLNRLIDRNGWLDIGRKRPIPHESWFEIAGYFHLYGHYYAARVIKELPEAERPRYEKKLAEILLRIQEKDGSWWDFPMFDYHKAYGTAFALMALNYPEDE